MKALCALALALFCSGSVGAVQIVDTDPDLSAVRAATEKYRDVKIALADGYVPAPDGMCEMAAHMGQPASLGGMGLHYFRPDLLGITAPPHPRVTGTGTHTDFLKPGVLIYEPQADGTLQLIAVENLVFEDAWHAAGHKDPPSFHGRPYEHMVDDPATPVDEAHMFAPHYDRHVWIYRENPNGVYAPFNPNVTCAYGKTQMSHAMAGHMSQDGAAGAPH